MRLVYATNIPLTLRNARSIQVLESLRAFAAELGDDFLGVVPSAPGNLSRVIVTGAPRTQSALDRLASAWRVYREVVRRAEGAVVFTRTVLLAGLLTWGSHARAVLLEVHELPVGVRLMLMRRIKRHVGFVCISQALSDDLRGLLGDGASTFVAHDGVSEAFLAEGIERSEARKRELPIGDEAWVVLYAGTWQQGKGAHFLLELARAVPEAIFVLVGPADAEMESLVRGTPNARIIPWVPRELMPRLLRAADVVALPMTRQLAYHRYTSPLKLFEYLASGTPLLASRLGPLMEVVDEASAWLHEPGDIDDAARALRALRASPDEAAKRAARGRSIAQKHTWRARVRAITAFAQQHLQEGRG